MTFYDYTKEHPDANVKIAVLTDDANEVAIPMRKGEETATLRAAIDTAIEELRADGTPQGAEREIFRHGHLDQRLKSALSHCRVPQSV